MLEVSPATAGGGGPSISRSRHAFRFPSPPPSASCWWPPCTPAPASTWDTPPTGGRCEPGHVERSPRSREFGWPSPGPAIDLRVEGAPPPPWRRPVGEVETPRRRFVGGWPLPGSVQRRRGVINGDMGRRAHQPMGPAGSPGAPAPHRCRGSSWALTPGDPQDPQIARTIA